MNTPTTTVVIRPEFFDRRLGEERLGGGVRRTRSLSPYDVPVEVSYTSRQDEKHNLQTELNFLYPGGCEKAEKQSLDKCIVAYRGVDSGRIQKLIMIDQKGAKENAQTATVEACAPRSFVVQMVRELLTLAIEKVAPKEQGSNWLRCKANAKVLSEVRVFLDDEIPVSRLLDWRCDHSVPMEASDLCSIRDEKSQQKELEQFFLVGSGDTWSLIGHQGHVSIALQGCKNKDEALKVASEYVEDTGVLLLHIADSDWGSAGWMHDGFNDAQCRPTHIRPVDSH